MKLRIRRPGRRRAVPDEVPAQLAPSVAAEPATVADEPAIVAADPSVAAPEPGAEPAPESAPEPAPEPEPAPAPDLAGSPRAALETLAEYSQAVLSWVADDGYPMNVAVPIDVSTQDGVVRFSEPAGLKLIGGTAIAVTGSSVSPLPDGGFDERRHVTVWGTVTAKPRGRFLLKPDRAWDWDERDLPRPAAYERGLAKAHRYYETLSAQHGVLIRPRLSAGELFVRATRIRFLGTALIPVLVGLAVAGRAGFFDATAALVTIVAAAAGVLGLNVANDIFDTRLGADDANATPTRYSGGSRVIQNGLVTIGEMAAVAACCLSVAVVLVAVLMGLHRSTSAAALAAVGLAIGLAYTMPPLKLAYRGLGELGAAIALGPVLVLGTYAFQSGGPISAEAALASLPMALLGTLVLFVNGIPDRAGDAASGKRTLSVRLSRRSAIAAFAGAAAVSFIAIVAGVVAGVLPLFALLALLAAPLAVRVRAGLDRFFDDPYGLEPTMVANMRLHQAVGLLLVIGFVLAYADRSLLGLKPFLW